MSLSITIDLSDADLAHFQEVVKRAQESVGQRSAKEITDAAGKLWSVYHQQKDDTQAWNRFICIDPLWFDRSGVLHGKATRGTAEPAPEPTSTLFLSRASSLTASATAELGRSTIT